MAEYQGMILGMEEAARRGVQNLHVYGDSELIARQMRGALPHSHRLASDLCEYKLKLYYIERAATIALNFHVPSVALVVLQGSTGSRRRTLWASTTVPVHWSGSSPSSTSATSRGPRTAAPTSSPTRPSTRGATSRPPKLEDGLPGWDGGATALHGGVTLGRGGGGGGGNAVT